jgi:hypothetical protein
MRRSSTPWHDLWNEYRLALVDGLLNLALDIAPDTSERVHLAAALALYWQRNLKEILKQGDGNV